MNTTRRLHLLIFIILVTACQSSQGCPRRTVTPDTLEETYNPTAEVYLPLSSTTPIPVEIKHKFILVDKVVEGELCNDRWDGTIYVACDVQVSKWENEPLFLKDCNLIIEPGTVVYVAYHNNAPYYKGCSCHTGDDPAQ